MDLKTILETENHETHFTFLGNDITVSAQKNIYNAIRNKYADLAQKAYEKFEQIDSEFTDIHDLVENAPNAFLTSMEDVLKEVLQDIISIDIYTVDQDTLIDTALDNDYFNDFVRRYKKIENRYTEIFEELDDAEYYREVRKETRPRWQSATFGGNSIQAWSNQLDVGAMNLVEGIAHSIFNAIGNAMSRSEAEKKLKNLFNTTSLRSEMCEGVWGSAFNMHGLIINFVQANTNIRFGGFVDDEDAEKAQAMFNNLTTLNLPSDKQVQFVKSIIELNPYNKDFYTYFIEKNSDQDNAIGEFAEHFGINSAELKGNILENFIDNNIGETEDDAKLCKQETDKLAQRIGVDLKECKSACAMIDERFEELDLQYRTVDDIVFDTRDEADTAKKELEQIDSIMGNLASPTRESTLKYEKDALSVKEQLENLKTDVKLKYIEEVDVNLKKFDKLFTESNTISREDKGKKLALIFAKSQEIKNYEQLDEAKQKLIDYLPETGLSDISEAEETCDYLQSLENKLNTVDEVIFDSREAAAEGRIEYDAITKIMENVNAPTNDSLLDYEADLLKVKSSLEQFKTPIREKYINRINIFLQEFDNKFRKISLVKTAATREEAAQFKALKFVKSKNYSMVDDVYRARKELNDFLPLVGLTIEQATQAAAFLAETERGLNTVGGVALGSAEEADKARKELAEIQSIMSNVRPPKSDSLLDYEQHILSVKQQISAYTTDVKLKYIATLDGYLADFDVKFRKISLFKTAETREEAGKTKALSFVKSQPYKTHEDVAMIRQRFMEMLPLWGLTEQQAIEAAEYINKLDQRVK